MTGAPRQGEDLGRPEMAVVTTHPTLTIESIGPTRKPSRFYLYAYLRADGSPYYIGKGTRGRAWAPHDHGRVRVPDKSRIVVLCEGLSNEESLEQEQGWIAHYGTRYDGTGILHNMTKGGDGLDPAWARTVKSGEWQWKRSYTELQQFCAELGINLPECKTIVPAPWLEKPCGRAKIYAMRAFAHWECLAPDQEQPMLPGLRLQVLKSIYYHRSQGRRWPFPPGFQLPIAEWSPEECFALLELLPPC
jgi:hypothetical protein